MVDLVKEILNDEPYEYYPIGNYVVKATGVCGGRPTFKYTRIEVAGTLDRIESGEKIDEVVKGYGGLVSREAILEAIDIKKKQAINPSLSSVA